MQSKTSYPPFVTTIGFAIISVLFHCGASAMDAGAKVSELPKVDPVTLAHIRDAAMSSDWAWRQLAKLTDEIGPRLSGSPQLTAAEIQVANTMRSLGAHVTLQAAKVPHWVRGEERAELIEYPGKPTGMSQTLR